MARLDAHAVPVPTAQEAFFERAGLAIARSTLAESVGKCGVQLQPLMDALAAEMLKQPVVHADETPVAIQAGPW